MEKLGSLWNKTRKAFSEEGVSGVARKTVSYIQTAITTKGRMAPAYEGKIYKDVLFINGCDYNALPHPPRYRVKHQIEQLRANNLDCDEVFHMSLDLDLVRNYRAFIIFRCPYTEHLGEFIRLAKSLHKTVIYDIDDLVIDTKYTDTVKYLDTLSKEDREGYDQGVNNMQKVLRMCDAAITTTKRLANELGHYVPDVYINRNTASEKMFELSETAYKERKRKAAQKRDSVRLGYFSGSITHNDDFVLIQPSVVKLMKKYKQVELHIVGILDIPKEMEEFKERVIAHPFVNWEKLPELIASIDINLAPLEAGIFNEAKSENKWVEAALVRVPTVASNVGAFAEVIQNEKTGMLCDTREEWDAALELLVTDAKMRRRIARNAYDYCKEHCLTLYTGFRFANYIRRKFHPNVAFVLPALNISGGIMVALEHCKVLYEAGYDVVLINDDIDSSKWCKFQDIRFPVLPSREYVFTGRFDKAVATMWSTVEFLDHYTNIGERYYLVQGFEPEFYEPNHPLRISANRQYSPIMPIQFLTISKWCEKWLKEKYDRIPRYLPNGLHAENYKPTRRRYDGKIRILVEGDCGVHYKNVDESFKITNQLDEEQFEIWYMSYNAEPKKWYRVDKFLHKVPFAEVSKVYQACHILLKTSFLESFSYPPLEMMATGGCVVAVLNDGNKEYLKDGENCLVYPRGNIQKGVEAIYKICQDKELREKFYENGIKTAASRDWNALGERILEFYDCRNLCREEKEEN
ncbi:glycosyltransferase [Suipraeoptans intestinalis]|uniref:glycosyltransferase n=1 Tax=Suipraeoptans intestinalis TaxID=2606628 RepID=UPI0023EF9CDE|nr:glycosyltransferase [Suipraeoptans intestinalis]MDD7770537.1 glycosyltransferase [Suipraeoptans intestinalis]MDY3122740.1 glycosyltransferase [Suipraeoptans intestinalis]